MTKFLTLGFSLSLTKIKETDWGWVSHEFLSSSASADVILYILPLLRETVTVYDGVSLPQLTYLSNRFGDRRPLKGLSFVHVLDICKRSVSTQSPNWPNTNQTRYHARTKRDLIYKSKLCSSHPEQGNFQLHGEVFITIMCFRSEIFDILPAMVTMRIFEKLCVVSMSARL